MIKCIEFCGLPGSGKSTLCSELLKELRYSNHRVFSRESALDVFIRRRDDGLLKNLLKRFPWAVWKLFMGVEMCLPEFHHFVTRNPGVMAKACACLLNHKVPQDGRQCILYALLRSCVEHDLRGRYMRQDEAVLMDEGLVHRIFTLFGYLPGDVKDDEIGEFVEAIPLPELVVHVKSGPAACLKRIAKRPEPNYMLSHLDAPGRLKQLVMADARLSLAVSMLERRGARVQVFDSNVQLEQTISEVKSFARSLIK